MKDGVSVKWSSCAATSFGAGDPWESVGNEVSDSGSLVSVQSPLTRGALFRGVTRALGAPRAPRSLSGVRRWADGVSSDGASGWGVRSRRGEDLGVENVFASFFEAVAIAITSVRSEERRVGKECRS